MENNQINTLCKIRDIYRSISQFEVSFHDKYELCLNEGMLLCSLSNTNKYSSSEIAEALGLSCSNTSKVIKSVENKGLIKRILGETDKRQMYFSLTEKGYKKLETIKCDKLNIPDSLQIIV